MCLHVVDETPTTNRKTGYKVFSTQSDYRELPRGKVGGQYFNTIYKLGDWNKSTAGVVEKDFYSFDVVTKYPMGFHIFLTTLAAQLWSIHSPALVIHRVAFREVVATGTIKYRSNCIGGETHKKVVVARQMKVLERVS